MLSRWLPLPCILSLSHTCSPTPETERPFKRTRFEELPPQTLPPKAQVEAKCRWYTFNCGRLCEQFSLDSPPRLDRRQTEIKMVDALAGFEKYFEYLATGELDGHLDSIRPEDKLEKFGVVLPVNPILLLHNLGKHPDPERIEGLFKPNEYGTCTITFVVLR